MQMNLAFLLKVRVYALLKESYRYLKKWGFKRFISACLLYLGRKLDSSINIEEVDKSVGSESQLLDHRLHYWLHEYSKSDYSLGLRLLEFRINKNDLKKTKEINEQWKVVKGKNIEHILWIMPDFPNVFGGGPHTTLRFAHYFANQGIRNTIIIFNAVNHKTKEDILRSVNSAFKPNKNVNFIMNPFWEKIDSSKLPRSDVAIATDWQTAYSLLEYHNTLAKFYFVQDYEPLFYPAGVSYGLAKATYNFGFYHICNTLGVHHMLNNNHKVSATYFTPAVDKNVFFSTKKRSDFDKIFFYGRPIISRNAYDLGIVGLTLIKEKYSSTQIFVAGWHQTLDLPFEAKFLGYLPYEKTGKLYRNCDMGISFMFTPHPSYILMQLMACGCLVISNKNINNSWLLKDGYNCILCDPTPISILEAYEKLRFDSNLRSTLRANALKTIEKISWESEMKRILKYIQHLEG